MDFSLIINKETMEIINKMRLPEEVEEILKVCPKITIPESRQHLLEISVGGNNDFLKFL
ncbi:hypothetical protein TheetDRAFT_3313 [Thermoanaerobacter ethanolicus JW 200]|nr:hypothetical protein TheetDRAFT_3313 [Thermoanaerobacter ethanolicus JW 200]